MTTSNVGSGEGEILGAFLRDLLENAAKEIAGAEVNVRANRQDGVEDDPESIRKLRLSFRRVQYQMETIGEIDRSLQTTALIPRLHECGKPFGKLRDAEILESRLVKALDTRGDTIEGRHMKELAVDARRNKQLAIDELLDSPAYLRVVKELDGYRSTLPETIESPLNIRPLAQRAINNSWQRLRRDAKKARRDSSDARLHAVRISAKRMMYVTQAFAHILGPTADELAERLDTLQHFLGTQHDHVIAAEWFKEVGRVHPELAALTKKISSEERQRAHHRLKRWRHFWKSVKNLHSRRIFESTPSAGS